MYDFNIYIFFFYIKLLLFYIIFNYEMVNLSVVINIILIIVKKLLRCFYFLDKFKFFLYC